ncbi:MAG: hypothetical protein EOO51_10205 [Flavobacterium sp.]|nr:MAG: hypothetical protein EOO51_10205 [Flavobacterium sp.]
MKNKFALLALLITCAATSQIGVEPEKNEVFESAHEKGSVSFRPSIGWISQKVEISRNPQYLSHEFKDSNIAIGLEVEYVLPTNRNKLAVIIEPNYSQFKAKSEYDNPGPTNGQVMLEFKKVSVPVGLRYKMFLTDETKAFLSGVFVPNFISGAHYSYSMNPTTGAYLEETSYGFGLGFGFEYKPVSIEFRYNTNVGLNPNYDVSYGQFGLILRYTVFRIK